MSFVGPAFLIYKNYWQSLMLMWTIGVMIRVTQKFGASVAAVLFLS